MYYRNNNSNNIQTWLDILIYCIRRFIRYDDVVDEAIEEVNIMVRTQREHVYREYKLVKKCYERNNES